MKESKYNWPWVVIAIYIGIVAATYAWNFRELERSLNPADWGTAGDYFGGFINPLSSLMALYFLIKAYAAQKEELSATRAALEATEKHQEASARAQERLAELEIERVLASQKSFMLQVISTNISALTEEVKFLSSEVERCTVAINNNRFVLSASGKKLHSDEEINRHRFTCLKSIDELVSEMRAQRYELKQYQSSV